MTRLNTEIQRLAEDRAHIKLLKIDFLANGGRIKMGADEKKEAPVARQRLR